jgi:hypothetical protein
MQEYAIHAIMILYAEYAADGTPSRTRTTLTRLSLCNASDSLEAVTAALLDSGSVAAAQPPSQCQRQRRRRRRRGRPCGLDSDPARRPGPEPKFPGPARASRPGSLPRAWVSGLGPPGRPHRRAGRAQCDSGWPRHRQTRRTAAAETPQALQVPRTELASRLSQQPG